MATIAQVAANQLNALKSTGPRTLQGKKRSAQNAVKWGLFSKHVILTEQDAADWDELSSRIRPLLQPSDPSEELLVDEVIANWFRLARCLQIDRGLFLAYANHQGRPCGLGTAFAQAAQLDCFGKLGRYEHHLERTLALSLQRLQSARQARHPPARPSPTTLAAPTSQAQAAIAAASPSAGAPSQNVKSGWREIIARVAAKWWTPVTRAKESTGHEGLP
jgi:hypothetical protein